MYKMTLNSGSLHVLMDSIRIYIPWYSILVDSIRICSIIFVSILFDSIRFCSILFEPSPLYSILFHSTRAKRGKVFDSIRLYSIWFYSILFDSPRIYSSLFDSILFYPREARTNIWFYAILFDYILFYCIRAKRGETFSILFDSIPF